MYDGDYLTRSWIWQLFYQSTVDLIDLYL